MPYIENSNYVCFWLIETLNNFDTSLNLCQNDNGSLGIIPDQKTLDWLNVYRKDAGKEFKEFYIGYKRDTLNRLLTLDGRLQTWAPWESRQPSGATGASCVTSFNRDATFWNPTTTNSATTETVVSSKHKLETSTSIVAFKPVTTAHNLRTTTDQSCRCTCKTEKVNSTLTAEYKAKIAANISKELSVNVETLSSTIRSKTSAKDDRPSSAGIGYVGVILLVTVFGGLMILDLPVFRTDVKLRLNNLKCCQKSKRIQC
ncbi:unnamed protein product [Mytilus coruscus]|uniref:C-type lectin domain-containing protein n=1 Tax=Mytilus coruscus TaxID=42192 RepID=A0A6J8EGN3_MYTCO|nr:unnamed protein product [Mytilus coruscus]